MRFVPSCYVQIRRQAVQASTGIEPTAKEKTAEKGDRAMASNGKQDKTFTQPVNWMTTFFMVVFHIGAIAAFFFFGWKPLLMAVFLWWVAGSLGIGMGYHRLLTHRGYQNSEMGRIFPDHLRDARARRRTDFLGGHAPQASPEYGQGRRPALASRRRLLGPHGLDPDRQGHA